MRAFKKVHPEMLQWEVVNAECCETSHTNWESRAEQQKIWVLNCLKILLQIPAQWTESWLGFKNADTILGTINIAPKFNQVIF